MLDFKWYAVTNTKTFVEDEAKFEDVLESEYSNITEFGLCNTRNHGKVWRFNAVSGTRSVATKGKMFYEKNYFRFNAASGTRSVATNLQVIILMLLVKGFNAASGTRAVATSYGYN